MYDNEEIFTITLIADGENSKLLLSTSETPAKEDEDASGVIYKEDLPEQFNEIVSKIPIFKEAIEEDGSEESITHTTSEFADMYELDLLDLIEKGEEILHVDLDDDGEADENEQHVKLVRDEPEEPEELADTKSSPYDIYMNDEPPSEEDALNYIDPREALENF